MAKNITSTEEKTVQIYVWKLVVCTEKKTGLLWRGRRKKKRRRRRRRKRTVYKCDSWDGFLGTNGQLHAHNLFSIFTPSLPLVTVWLIWACVQTTAAVKLVLAKINTYTITIPLLHCRAESLSLS